MPDLSEFGGGVEAADSDDDGEEAGGFGDDHGYQYRTGRCRAIDTSGERCSAPSTHGEPCCHMHAMDERVVTIDHDPIELMEATSRMLWDQIKDENEIVACAVWSVVEGGGRDLSSSGGDTR